MYREAPQAFAPLAELGTGFVMIIPALLVAAILLGLERITYIWVWHRPASFRKLSERLSLLGEEPVDVLQKFFYGFKALQLAVFVGWCIVFAGDDGLLPSAGPLPIAIGILLIAAGQVLNFSVFYRLGKIGVFYGNRLGHQVAWQNGFPFSIVRHPQYIGALLSIWGFFLIMRFPHADWVALPLLQTLYYALAAHYEA